MVCPKCSKEMECMVALGGDETISGKTEWLYLCRECHVYWEATEEEDGSVDIKQWVS